jgi:hypothetical protein
LQRLQWRTPVACGITLFTVSAAVASIERPVAASPPAATAAAPDPGIGGGTREPPHLWQRGEEGT